jgi:hypothetical protein
MSTNTTELIVQSPFTTTSRTIHVWDIHRILAANEIRNITPFSIKETPLVVNFFQTIRWDGDQFILEEKS